MIRFSIPYPADRHKKSAWMQRYGMNAYYSGKHWTYRSQDSRYWHALVWEQMAKARIPKRVLEVPVEIWFRWNDGLDIDNHAAMGKMIVDGMKGYLLKDDKPRYLKGVHHVFQTEVRDKKRNAIIVEVRQYEEHTSG